MLSHLSAQHLYRCRHPSFSIAFGGTSMGVDLDFAQPMGHRLQFPVSAEHHMEQFRGRPSLEPAIRSPDVSGLAGHIFAGQEVHVCLEPGCRVGACGRSHLDSAPFRACSSSHVCAMFLVRGHRLQLFKASSTPMAWLVVAVVSLGPDCSTRSSLWNRNCLVDLPSYGPDGVSL